MKKLISILTILLFTLTNTFAQESGVEMAEVLRSSGKIYVVVAVMALVFIGIAIYLFLIDRRISKLENKD